MLTAVLRDAGIRYATPEGAFYLFCKVPDGGPAAAPVPGPASAPGESSDVAFAMALKDHGVLAVPGTGFGCPGWFRLSYCVPEPTIEGSRAAFKAAAAVWRG
jgi:aspartate aminotransferase